jgi:hypothetical protein
MGSSESRSKHASDHARPDSVRSRLGGLFSKAANHASEGAGRLREVAGAAMRPSALQHALVARERGNLEAAFWLLDEVFRKAPADAETTLALWEVALDLDRAPAAAAAGVSLIEKYATDGAIDLAVQHFSMLADRVPDARVSPSAIVRMLPLLRNRISASDEEQSNAAHALACAALENALSGEASEGVSGLTPGLALHLFKEAKVIDPDAATRAAEIALTSPDLHEVRREELRCWLESIDGAEDADLLDETPASSEEPSEPLPDLPEEADELVLPPLSEGEVVDAARRLEGRHGPDTGERELLLQKDMQVIAGVPISFEEEALEVRLPGGRTSRVGWKEIQALSVVELTGGPGGPVILIDCILNWRQRSRETLRLVRLRANDFSPADLIDAEDADLAAFLTDLLERSQAAPLPGPESALGLQIAAFEDLDQYEREVLQLD